VQKLITKFLPPSTHPVAEAEAQYVGVHIPTARDIFLLREEEVVYYTLKVLRQYDYGGRWNHRLTAWRFVIRYVDRDLLPEGTEDDSVLARRQRLANRDQPHSIGGVRRFEADEEVLVDRRSGQTSQVKYLFEYERDPAMPLERARALLNDLVTQVLESAGEVQGLRLILVDWVRREVRIDWREDGQYDANEWSTDSTCVGFLEFVFDSAYWGEQFFARPMMNLIMLDYRFTYSMGYLVNECCELDKR
jgi:hypothetical protein